MTLFYQVLKQVCLPLRLPISSISTSFMRKFRRFFVVSIGLWACLAIFSSSWCPESYIKQANRAFEQKANRFWKFEQQTNRWVEVELPHDLVSCTHENCVVVGSIRPSSENKQEEQSKGGTHPPNQNKGQEEETFDAVLPVRKRVSVTKITDSSIFVTGPSGSIYQRFWNGIQWVISDHNLPLSAGYAVSVFFVDEHLLALSETGSLYQMTMPEQDSSPIWVELTPMHNHSPSSDTEQSIVFKIKSGAVSHDRMRVYFCSHSGSLLELAEVSPPSWVSHGRPPGADVAKIVDASVKPELVFTISSTGDLYEYDPNSKPSWKKHIWGEGQSEAASLVPYAGSSFAPLAGPRSRSLFLLTEAGKLVERHLNQRKWKWIVHGKPRGHRLASIMLASNEESSIKPSSLFLTTESGSVFEYQLPGSSVSGNTQDNTLQGRWVNHMYPENAKAARGVAGIQLQVGRMVFPLDDGRLAELHLPGVGGETAGPTSQVKLRRKALQKYVWSVIDGPETEGWNAEYCTEERGPGNCIAGTNEPNEESARLILRKRNRKGIQSLQGYLTPDASDGSAAKYKKEHRFQKNWINSNFHLRVLHEGRAFFLVTSCGLAFECIVSEDMWLWIRHEHATALEGALGTYNASAYVVDREGNLLIRERSNEGLAWINCTAMRKGRPVVSGPPWNLMHNKIHTPRDSLFFVSKSGRLLQFTVAMKKFEWRDCRNPSNSKVASIVDQEIFRENIVFVVGKNGQLYQYNKVTELWHAHYQAPHLVLARLPGTAIRPSPHSLRGSLFMLSEDGELLEYHWTPLDGWKWVEHGSSDKSVTLVSAPAPSGDGSHLFLIGSDGNVYLRYIDGATWKWKNYTCPHKENMTIRDQTQVKDENEGTPSAKEFSGLFDKEEEEGKLTIHGSICDPKVAAIRALPISSNAVIFELRDGRLAELRQVEEMHWIWYRVVGTPTTLCAENYWYSSAS